MARRRRSKEITWDKYLEYKSNAMATRWTGTTADLPFIMEVKTGKCFILFAGVLFNDTTKQQPVAVYYPRDHEAVGTNRIQLPLVLGQPAVGQGGCITDPVMCPFPIKGPARLEIDDLNAGVGDAIIIELLYTEVEI